MPWRPLPRIAFAVATFPFQPSSPADLPLELGDELYIIEQGGKNGSWYRGYLVAPPSLLSGLTSVKGQTLEARVFSGIFPKSCVEVREVLGDVDGRRKLTNGITNGDTPGARDLNDDTSPQNGRSGDNTRPNSAAARLSSGETTLKSKREINLQRSSSVSAQSSPQTPQASIPLSPGEVPPRQPGEPKPQAPVPMLKVGDETPTSAAEPLVDEIASCLREWHSTNLHELLLARQYGTLEKMSSIVAQLDLSRRQLLHNVLTAQERSSVRDYIVWSLVKGNKMLGGEIIVRDPKQRGRLLTGDDSAIEMTKLQSIMSLLDANLTSQSEAALLHHLLFEIKTVSNPGPGPLSMTVSLYLKSEDGTCSPLSETFSIELESDETFGNLVGSSRLKTIFTDLAASDIGEKNTPADHHVYLVIKMQAHRVPRNRPESRGQTVTVSRDGPPSTKANNAFNTAGKGSIRAGRRSLMFGAKSRGPVNGERLPGRENNRTTPTERAPSADKLRTATSHGPEADVSRTIAAGAIEVTQILKQDKPVDFSVDLWSPAETDDEEDSQADQMDDTIASVLQSPTGRYIRSTRAPRMQTSLSPYAAQDAETLIKANPTSMHMITRTEKIGFSEAPTKPRSDIYLTLSEAVIPRGGSLSHPESGQVPIANSTDLHNLQLTMEVRDATGKRIESCIYPSSNGIGHTAWRTNVAEQGIRWDQTICLKIPPELVPGSHLIMSMANAPEFPFALSWMPLWHDNAFIRDGHHTLLMHAYDKSTSSLINGKGAYLSLPWRTSGISGISKDESVTGPTAMLVAETFLCSTKYSQDPVILSLINWRMQSSSQLLDALKKIVFVPEIEVVKQMRDVFDALFAILVHKTGETEYEDLVFNDLVTVLGIIHDRRFNLGPLVDHYTETQFNYPFATACLIKSYLRLLQNASDPKSARTLRSTFKVGRHVLKFIMRARSLQKSKEEGLGITKVQSTFNADLKSIFSFIEDMMRNQAPILVGSKTLVVQHLHTWLPELLAGFSEDEVGKMAIRIIDATDDVKGKLILYKIILILNCVQLEEIFTSSADTHLLASHCLRWLAPYWGSTEQVNDQWRDQVRLCSSVVAELTDRPGSTTFEFMPKVVTSYCSIQAQGVSEKTSLSLLFPRSFPFPSRTGSGKQQFDEALLELSALMAVIFEAKVPSTFSPSESELSPYILSTLEAHKSILNCEAYPATWLSLHVYHHRSTMKALDHLSTLLTKSYLPSPDYADQFDMEIWKAFFETLLKLISSDALALETFAEQKRRAVWKIAGDVRENGAALLRRSWESIGWDSSPDEKRRYGLKRLGGYQVQYVPSLIPPIVELCLSVHGGLRGVAVEILQTMIVSEWALSEDLSMIETEMIASLDLIFKKKTINESITQKLFIGELLGLFGEIATMPDDALWIALKELVTTIDELMDLLVNAHGESMTENLHTMRLMEFMKDMQKEDIFVRYVHELAEKQEASKNPTEAGLALQSHADLYEWDSDHNLPAIEKPIFPEGTAFDRKEALYFQMIRLFEDGKCWNNALASYRELADQYEHVTFDYAKLARTQRAMGKVHEAISRDDRHLTRYFRVAYLGLGFPSSLRDKEYIFEGLPSERIAAFTDRMQKQHPAAQVVSSRELDDMEGQYIHISSVSPHKDIKHPVFQRTKVSPPVREHLLTSNPIQFSVTSKRQVAGTNVKEQWVEKTVFTTAEAFPTILKRSEIVTSEVVRLSPLQTAIERTWRKTGDLAALEKKAGSSEDPNNAALTEMLSQLLDMETGTGSCMAHYRQFLAEPLKAASPLNDDGDADLSDDEDPVPPERDPVENALFVALSDHASTIKRCLTLYTRPSSQATRNDLKSRFEKIYPEEHRLKTPPSTAHHAHTFSASSPPRVSLDAGGKIAIDSSHLSIAPASDSRPFSPEQPLAVFTGARSHRPEKSSRISLHFLKGATSAMIPGSGQMSKDLGGGQIQKPDDVLTPVLRVNGLNGGGVDSIATTFPHDAFSGSTTANEQHEQSSHATSASARSRSKSRTGLSMFGGSVSQASEDDYGKPSVTDGSGVGLPVNMGPGGLRGRDESTSGITDDRPLTAGSSHTTGGGGGGATIRPGIKKRFSLLKLGKKKSEGNVRVSEVPEE